MIFRNVFLAILLSITTGCASSAWLSNKENELAQSGPGTSIDATLVAAYAKKQGKVLAQLKVLTGLTSPSWDQIISAGLQYSDARCSDYVESLYAVHKQLKADARDVNAAGTLATGIMGVYKAAANEIATVAVLFGYAEGSIDIAGSRMLFELEPSAIRALVEGSQKAFRAALTTGYTDQSGAFAVIREHVALCLPSTIEAEINNAAKTAIQTAVSGNPATGEPPKVSINEAQIKVIKLDPIEQESVTSEAFTDRADLKSLVDNLDTTAAKSLLEDVSREFTAAAEIISTQYTPEVNANDADGSKAKILLRRLVTLFAKNDQDRAKWRELLE